MTKKDYNAIVDAIVAMVNPIRRAITGGGERGAHGEAATRQIVEIIAAQLGLVFARDNKDFDSFRFMEALNKRLARTRLPLFDPPKAPTEELKYAEHDDQPTIASDVYERSAGKWK